MDEPNPARGSRAREPLTQHQRAELSRARRALRGETECGRCHGKGKVVRYQDGRPFVDEDPCRGCGGDGKLHPDPVLVHKLRLGQWKC